MSKYLGKPGKYFMMVSMIIGIYGALTAYILGEGEIFKIIIGGNPFLYSFAFFLIASAILYHGIKATGRAELAVTALMIITIFIIGAFAYDKINFAYLTGTHIKNFFMPYGVILFAFVGTAAIPEIRAQLSKDRQKLKKAIIIGSIIPILLYLIFAIVVVGVVGLANFESLGPNERIATIALSIFSEPHLALFANIFAAFAMLTSFLGLGLALKEMYMYDCGINRTTAFFLTVSPPLAIALLGLTSFITVIAFAGAVAGGIDGILIMLAYWKAKKKGDRKPEYSLKMSRILTALLILMFAFGIIYQLLITLM
jgi:tyrosine-specific transport protein